MLCKLLLIRERGVERKDWRQYVKQDGGDYCRVEIYNGNDTSRHRRTLIAEATECDGKIKPTLLARLYDVELLGMKGNALVLAGLDKICRFGQGPDQYVAQTWHLVVVGNGDGRLPRAPAARVGLLPSEDL